MDITLEQLEFRLANAKEWRCWRVVCARIRNIARHKQFFYGKPYDDTLRQYNYDFYHKRVKD